MGDHRDDQDFGAVADYPIFTLLEKGVSFEASGEISHPEEVEIDLSDLEQDSQPLDISPSTRVTKPMAAVLLEHLRLTASDKNAFDDTMETRENDG